MSAKSLSVCDIMEVGNDCNRYFHGGWCRLIVVFINDSFSSFGGKGSRHMDILDWVNEDLVVHVEVTVKVIGYQGITGNLLVQPLQRKLFSNF